MEKKISIAMWSRYHRELRAMSREGLITEEDMDKMFNEFLNMEYKEAHKELNNKIHRKEEKKEMKKEFVVFRNCLWGVILKSEEEGLMQVEYIKGESWFVPTGYDHIIISESEAEFISLDEFNKREELAKTELFVVNVSHFNKKANDLYSHSFIVSNIQDAKNIHEREISKIEEYVRLNSLEHNSYHDNVEDEDVIDLLFELYSKDKIFSVNLTMKEVK